MSKIKHVAVILSSTNVRRLLPGVMKYSSPYLDYWLINVLRSSEEIIEVVKRWNPAGILTEPKEGFVEIMRSNRKPLVLVPANIDWSTWATSVNIDDVEVGQIVAQYFIDLGIRNFAFFGVSLPYSKERLKGYSDVLTKAGYSFSVFEDQENRPVEFFEYWKIPDKKFSLWLRHLPKPVGIFAVHDPLGRGIIEACRDLNIKIPDEIAIVGANNDELICGIARPALSSVEIDWEKIGFDAAYALELMIHEHKPAPPKMLIKPLGVVARKSSDIIAIENQDICDAIRFIHGHAHEMINVSDILRNVGISRRVLERQFKKELNRTPFQELLRVRIELAKKLLATTDLPTKNIVARCGMADARRLSLLFKQKCGLTPSAYRKQFRLRH